VFTSRIRSKASKQELTVPAMPHPVTGAVVGGGKPLAQLVADFWANISKEPNVDAAAEQEVLAAVQAANLSMSEVVAASVGAREVSEAEVRKALKHSAPGKAPGLDGLPVELYRRCKDVFVPLLARLYTAIGVTGCVPAGFTEGVIVTFYKSGPRSVTGNYRPITLLNTDYRLLAKILASRLAQVLGGVIGVEQSAFLPGRQIADNVRLLQLLPHALPISSEGVVAFLDFRKAYDTVSRAFLFKLLELAGLGGDFLMWVKLLLHDTRSRACVNGFVSNPVLFKAGVRQGCPLAPLLYLLVGQALLLFLKSKQLGVMVGGRLLTANQFADDTHVFLHSRHQLPILLHALSVFEAASGQGLNKGKTRLMLIGHAARREYWSWVHRAWFEAWYVQQQQQQQPQQPLHHESPSQQHQQHEDRAVRLAVRRTARGQLRRGEDGPKQMHDELQRLAREWQVRHRQAAITEARITTWVNAAVTAQLADDPCFMRPDAELGGLKLVGEHSALGVVHMANGCTKVDWDALVDQVEARYNRIAKLPLSMFGRGFAASAYGLSKLLYAAQFVQVPQDAVLQHLQAVTAKLVDRGQPPTRVGQAFAGIAAEALVGHPKDGGCGVLPLVQHLHARHAKAAMRLVLEPSAVPWIHVARCILVPASLSGCPSWQHCVLPACNAATAADPAAIQAPGDMRVLPAPLVPLVQALQALPQWRDISATALVPGAWCCNCPLWCNPLLMGAQGQSLPWRGLEAPFSFLASLGTINTIADAVSACREVQQVTTYQQYREQVWAFWLKRSPVYADRQVAQSHLEGLVAAIPAAFRQHVESMTDAERNSAPTAVVVWQQLLGRLGWCMPGGKQYGLAAMSVKLFTALQWPTVLQGLQVRHDRFLGAVAGSVVQELPPVQSSELRSVLSSVWSLKWENKHKEVLWRLLYDGFPTAARMHKTDRPCACGVMMPDWRHHFWSCPIAQAVVQTMRAQLPQDTPVLQVHLWLGRIPMAGMHTGVWHVTMLAALRAMHKARKLLDKWRLEQMEGGVVPQHIATPPLRVQVASRLAVATFWDLLYDFAALRLYKPAWLLQVSAVHPFLATRVNAQGESELFVNKRVL
jgi:hypothetical protein